MDEDKLAHKIRQEAKRMIAEETEINHRDDILVNSVLEKAAHYKMPQENEMPRNWNNCLNYIESSENMLLLTSTDITFELASMIEQVLEQEVASLQDARMVEQPEGTDKKDIERFIETREKKIQKVKELKRSD